MLLYKWNYADLDLEGNFQAGISGELEAYVFEFGSL